MMNRHEEDPRWRRGYPAARTGWSVAVILLVAGSTQAQTTVHVERDKPTQIAFLTVNSGGDFIVRGEALVEQGVGQFEDQSPPLWQLVSAFNETLARIGPDFNFWLRGELTQDQVDAQGVSTLTGQAGDAISYMSGAEMVAVFRASGALELKGRLLTGGGGVLTVAAQENPANPILIGEDLLLEPEGGGAPGLTFSQVFFDGIEAAPGALTPGPGQGAWRVPPGLAARPRGDEFDPDGVNRTGTRVLALTSQGMLVGYFDVRRVALVSIGKVRELAVIDVSDPVNLVEMGGRIPISDGLDTDFLPTFGFVQISQDGRVAMVTKDLNDDFDDLKNEVDVIDLIGAIGAADPASFVTPVGGNELMEPSAIALLPGRPNEALVVPEFGRWETGLPTDRSIEKRDLMILDFSDPASPILSPSAGSLMEGFLDLFPGGVFGPRGVAANVGAVVTPDGHYALISQGPYHGYINVIDLQGGGDFTAAPRVFPDPALNPQPVAGSLDPTERRNLPVYLGPADIAVTQDSQLAFISHGLLNERKVQALSLTNIQSQELPVLAQIQVVPESNPNPLLAMGVDLDREDQYALYANTRHHSVAAVSVNDVRMGIDPPAVDLFDLTELDVELADELTPPPGGDIRTGPYDLAVDPKNKFVLVSTNGGVFTLDLTTLLNTGTLKLFPGGARGQLALTATGFLNQDGTQPLSTLVLDRAPLAVAIQP